MIYPWQVDDWNRLRQLQSRWPHALLLYGQAGIGKLHFAQHLAQGLLCESRLVDSKPCNACLACNWFVRGNHPDYRITVPEALAGILGEENATNNKVEKKDTDRSKKNRAISMEIKIEQVRALLDFSDIGSHRGGMRVIILYPAEALNVVATNALLKTIEEPPSSVVFLLVSACIDRLLPTIVSRCYRYSMSTPTLQVAGAWLTAQGINNAFALLAEAGGAPLIALTLASSGNCTLRDWMLKQLAAGRHCDALACGEVLQRLPVPLVLGWLQRWLYDLFAQHAIGMPRYFPQASMVLTQCGSKIDLNALTRFQKVVMYQRMVEHHPLNARLMFESLFFNYREIFLL